jgi:hypothetical protein
MNATVFALCLSCIVVTSACKDQPTQPSGSDQFIGTWVLKAYEDDLTVMERSLGLDSSKYGFKLFPDGRVLERKNAGWCGTPPITYGNFSGEWKAITDSLLDINVGYWGGRLNYRLQIVALTKSELRVRYHYPC